MKSKILAAIALFSVFSLVFVNSIYLSRVTDEIYERCSECDTDSESAYADFTELFDFYKKHERLISITVNHEDLTAINEDLCEILGLLSIGDKEGAKVTKSRLLGSLEHLGRLSGINIDSII